MTRFARKIICENQHLASWRSYTQTYSGAFFRTRCISRPIVLALRLLYLPICLNCRENEHGNFLNNKKLDRLIFQAVIPNTNPVLSVDFVLVLFAFDVLGLL